jgi:hypothetical protein
MPLGVTLLELRRELRAETGTSMNPAQGTQAQSSLDIILARQQRELWDAYNWQHLKLWLDMELTKGQTTYDFPEIMLFEQVQNLYVAASVSSEWKRLTYGIDPWMIKPSGVGLGTPARWRNVVGMDLTVNPPLTKPDGQFELIPAPSTDDMLIRFDGMAPLNRLVSDTDTCVIDSKAIVLFAAAEVMATQKNEAAPMKLTKAQNYLRRLLADQGADKRANYNMGGVFRGGNDPDKSRRAVPYIDYIPG